MGSFLLDYWNLKLNFLLTYYHYLGTINLGDRPLNKSKFHQHFLLCAKHFLRLSPKDNKLIRNLILDSNNPIEMIPSGYWQAAKSTGEFTLVSCCVGPGFDFKDFELLRNTNHTSRLDKAINDLI